MSTISTPHARHGRPLPCGSCRRDVHQIIDSIEPLDPADTDVVEVSCTCIEGLDRRRRCHPVRRGTRHRP